MTDKIRLEVDNTQTHIQGRARMGGTEPPGDGMEYRVQRLEADMSEIKSDMKAVRSDLAELKGKVSMLPGYPGIATIMALVGGALLVVARLFPSGTP
jgi:hypothetical protein